MECVNKFVIISEPRTGSTVLSNILQKNEHVICQGELFHPEQVYWSFGVADPNIKAERDKTPIVFLNDTLRKSMSIKNDIKAVGFKLFFDHNARITKHILENKYSIILLERGNKLAQYASIKLARNTGQWNSSQEITRSGQRYIDRFGKRVNFSLLEFVAFSLRSKLRFKKMKLLIQKRRLKYVHIMYEDLFHKSTFDQLNSIIPGCSIQQLTPNYSKQGQKDVFDRFINKQYVISVCKIFDYFGL